MTTQERADLRSFRRAARQVRESSAIEEGLVPALHFNMEGRGGFMYFAGLSASGLIPQEAFRSVLAAVRLAYMDNEPANFGRICNILHRRSETDLQKQVARLRYYWNHALREGFRVSVRNDDTGEERSMTPGEILETWFNAEVFHLDQDREPDLAFVKSSEIIGQFAVQKILLYLAGRIIDLDDLVAEYLDEEQLPRIEPPQTGAVSEPDLPAERGKQDS